jgi:uncharacterized short protein YbdD (DUF466 family)
MFDIVIPVGPKDYEVIKYVIEYAQKNIIAYRNTFLISEKDLSIPNTIFISESVFPFTINHVKQFHGDTERAGWYYQQLLKFYAGFFIANITTQYLIIDADTFFLKPVSFLENETVLFNSSHFNHTPYFEHMKRLHPLLTKQDPNMSGVSHHMMFDINCVNQLIDMVETYHKNDKPFWQLFLEAVEKDQVEKSGASEYEIYFNFMKRFHSDKIKIRELKWKDCCNFKDSVNFDYISIHWYGRNSLSFDIPK